MRVHGGAAVFCAALLIRAVPPLVALALTGGTRTFRAPDSALYLSCAESLARGGGFSAGGEPEIVRTPGYPILLVPGVLAGHPAAVTVALQIALGAFTAWLVHLITGLLTGSPRAAAIAGTLFACEPLSALYCGILLSETLFTAVLVLAAWLLARRASGGGRWVLAGAALALAASAYVRPIAYWLPIPAAGYLLWAARRGGVRRAAFEAAAFLALCAALTGVWRARNYIETGYRGFSAIFDLNPYFCHGAAVEAAAGGESYYDVQRRMESSDYAAHLARNPGHEALAPAERYARMGRAGAEIIRRRPLLFAAIYAKGVARALLDPGAADWLKYLGLYREGGGLLGEAVDRGLARTALSLAGRRPGLFWTGVGLGVLLAGYLAAAACGVSVIRSLAPGAGAAALVLAYILLLSGGPNALARFRHPAMPFVCVFAGCGIAGLGKRDKIKQ